jgi:flagellar basal body P-ring formation protein FlgA
MLNRIFNSLCIIFLICLLIALGKSIAFSSQKDVGAEDKLAKAIKEHIEKNMPWPADSVRIELTSRPPAIDEGKGKLSFKVESRPKEDYLGDTSFNVRIFQSSIFLKEETVRVRIEILREFVVSTNNLGRDAIITSNDISLQKKWVRSIPVNAISTLEEATGKMICVSIRPNTEITRNMLKEVMPVKRGKMVHIILDNGVMKITTMGLSEEDGAEGAIVKVRNITSSKIIYARVIGEAKVKIDF